ncbi:MAG: ABC transporter ATP-binding protein [Arcanobacterium sp.]|nr:ABC transporter ATP-binding protein [Arcanobacterium sp.]
MEVQDLHFRYSRKSLELGPINLSTKPGQIWAILGANGSGKSTLLNLLHGSFKTYAGTIDKKEKSVLLPQKVSIKSRLSTKETLQYLALLQKVPKADREQLVNDLIADFHLADFSHTHTKHLSGGQAQRLLIAQAFITSPEILLLDEPSVGLDVDSRNELKSALRKNAADTCVFISSHIIEDLTDLATHILHLDSGKQIFSGPVSDYLEKARANSTEGTPQEPIDFSDSRQWIKAYEYWRER